MQSHNHFWWAYIRSGLITETFFVEFFFISQERGKE